MPKVDQRQIFEQKEQSLNFSLEHLNLNKGLTNFIRGRYSHKSQWDSFKMEENRFEPKLEPFNYFVHCVL
jgi:hypothetical protein